MIQKLRFLHLVFFVIGKLHISSECFLNMQPQDEQARDNTFRLNSSLSEETFHLSGSSSTNSSFLESE